MGIRRLTQFIEENYNWNKITISDGKLVIDGNGLCYQLYSENHHWAYGGEYTEFYETVTKFFWNLRDINVEPIVLLDGVDIDLTKAATVIERMERRNIITFRHMHKKRYCLCRTCVNGPSLLFVIPLFTRMVFVDVLRDLGIKFCVADGEADPDLVALANYYQCPLLAADSDFFIYNVQCGYIPFKRENALVPIQPEMEAYSVASFCKQFGFRDESFRFFLPAILGNDFMNAICFSGLDTPKAIIRRSYIMKTVSQFVNDLEVQNSYKRKLGTSYYKAQMMYESDIKLKSFQEILFKTSYKFASSAPQWVLALYKNWRLTPNIINVIVNQHWICYTLVEDMCRRCAWSCSRRIRQYICGIAIGKQVKEIIRLDCRNKLLSSVILEPEFLSPQLYLVDIPSLSCEDRAQIFSTILHCRKMFDNLESCLDIDAELENWKLVIAATRYWFLESADPAVDVDLAKALILLFVTRSGHVPERQKWMKKKRPFVGGDELNLALHCFAQWQCVYSDVLALNQLLMEPIADTVSIADLYCGSIVLRNYSYFCHGIDVERLMLKKNPHGRRFYRTLLWLVTDIDVVL